MITSIWYKVRIILINRLYFEYACFYYNLDIYFWSTLMCINPSYYLCECHILRGSITLFYLSTKGEPYSLKNFLSSIPCATFLMKYKKGEKDNGWWLMMVSSWFLIFIKFCLSSKRGRFLALLSSLYIC